MVVELMPADRVLERHASVALGGQRHSCVTLDE
jgi:hypothetical protein